MTKHVLHSVEMPDDHEPIIYFALTEVPGDEEAFVVHLEFPGEEPDLSGFQVLKIIQAMRSFCDHLEVETHADVELQNLLDSDDD